jgi:hypothetical protein
MLFSQPIVELEEFEARSGWHLRPEGLCQDDLCIPLQTSPLLEGKLDLRLVAAALGMPVVEDVGLVAIGPRTSTHVLPADARAPELRLPDIDGNAFDLASLHGTRVLLLAWASW